MKIFSLLPLFLILATVHTDAQEFVSPTHPVESGKAPAAKVRLLSSNGNSRTYVIVFSPGDEVRSGLNDFAKKYNITSAHYTAIGDVFSAKVGFFDYQRKMFRVILIDTSEVASLTGNIAVFNGTPTAHTHVSLAMKDGSLKGGHLLELFVGPTLEVFVSVEPIPLYKKLDKRYDAGVIDPELEK